MTDSIEKVLNILVIGFHHKKGCQLEFCYPPLETLPEPWKHLPSLAMPDGAHNFKRDVVFFHLPSITEPVQTVFGVSCFQQIPVEKVKNRTADMTRGTVQKAVCVLTTSPLFGYIQVKMQLITASFFDKADFSETSLLVEAFHNFSDCLPGSSALHLHDGLSAKDFLFRFKHRSLLLFKLLLLERKVVFFHSPVEPLCTTILSLLSLMPGLIQTGLTHAASTSVKGSPVTPISPLQISSSVEKLENSDIISEKKRNSADLSHGDNDNTHVENATDPLLGEDLAETGIDALLLKNDLNQDFPKSKSSGCSGCDNILASLNFEGCGIPLSLFGKGNLCFPYLSISYLDFLSSPGVRGFVVGATNVLFKQKRSLADIIIEVEDARIETAYPELRRQLALTTEDLRFMDGIVRNVLENSESVSDAQIRSHFHMYLVSLLRTSLLQDGSREMDSFNPHFMAAWKNTHNYKMWFSEERGEIREINPGHPSAGSLSVHDVKLKLSHAMLDTESGRKINQAVANTGRAVGGAVTQARGVISGWWNSFTQEQKPIMSSENI